MKTRKEGHIICDGCHKEKPELDGLGFTASNIYCDACLNKPHTPTQGAYKATPAPWKNDGRFITMSDGTEFHLDSVGDAAFIVRAVNEYDRLKRIEEKAKLAVDCIETLQARNGELLGALQVLATHLSGWNTADKRIEMLANIAKQAIAKAEGK